MNKIKNIAGYQFLQLSDLDKLRQQLLDLASDNHIKGTILLSEEGINLNMAGEEPHVESFVVALSGLPQFDQFKFHETYSDAIPFRMLKVKIKPEIVTLRQPRTSPTEVCLRAPGISPLELKKWLDEKRDIVLLDTRNDFEYRFGTFEGAINPNVESFGALPEVMDKLDRAKPVVMFCTGGIRCEKAAIYMQNHGFKEVYQLDGGILGYFRQAGGAHYIGECFVFDGRVAVDTDMRVTGTAQCVGCRGPVYSEEQQTFAFQKASLCSSCADASMVDQDAKQLNEVAI